MTSEKKDYQVGTIKTLVDLNGLSTNFDIKFRVASKNREPFDAVVISQSGLDSNQPLQYKKVENGELSGSVTDTKNIYQNYLLVLRADNPCVCEVEIWKKELPKSVPPPPKTEPTPLPHGATISDSFNWVKLFLVLFVIAGIGYALYLFSQSEKKGSGVGEIAPTVNVVPSVPKVAPVENPLIQRLKNLNLS